MRSLLLTATLLISLPVFSEGRRPNISVPDLQELNIDCLVGARKHKCGMKTKNVRDQVDLMGKDLVYRYTCEKSYLMRDDQGKVTTVALNVNASSSGMTNGLAGFISTAGIMTIRDFFKNSGRKKEIRDLVRENFKSEIQEFEYNLPQQCHN